MRGNMIIQIEDDFDIGKIAESGQCFRCSQSDGQYRFITGNDVLYIKYVAKNTFLFRFIPWQIRALGAIPNFRANAIGGCE